MNFDTAMKRAAKKNYVMGQAKTLSVQHQDGSIFILRHAHVVAIGTKQYLAIKTEHHGDFVFFRPDVVSFRVL